MAKIGRSGLVTAAVVLGLAAPALAEVTVAQSVDRAEVGSDDTFRVTVTVSGLEHEAELALPRSRDLEIVGQSQSTQTSYASGASGVTANRQQQITLIMRATHQGKITIPGAQVTTAGTTLHAEPVAIDVKPGHVAAAAPPPDPNDPFAALGLHGFGGLADPFSDDEDPLAALGGAAPLSASDVQVVTTLDRRSVYVGAQATLQVWLLTRVGLSVTGLEMPKIDGALTEDLSAGKQPKEEIRTLHGVRYHAFLVGERAIFPLHAGRLDIGPAEVQVTANSLLRQRQLTPRSAATALEVRPVPPGGPPGEVVGSWNLSATVEPAKTVAGEPATLRLVAEGTGDLKALTLPRPEPMDGLTTYPPSTTDTPSLHAGKLGGKRVQEIVIVPSRAGSFTIPSLSLAYFDPATGRHRSSRTAPLTLQASPGVAPAVSASTSAPATASDGAMKPLRGAVSLAPSRPAPWRRASFWSLIAIPALLFALGEAWRRRRGRTVAAPSARRRLRAARRHLAAAEQLRERPLEQCAAIERALRQLCAAQLARDVHAMPRERIDAELAKSGMPADQRQRLVTALELSHAARFAPATATGSHAAARALDLARQALEPRSAA